MTDLYVSTGAFGALPVSSIVRLCQKHGIDALELSSGADVDPFAWEAIGSATGMRFLIHNYFPTPEDPFVLNLATRSDEIARRSVDHCKHAIELCAWLGSPFFSFHAGFAIDPAPEQLGGDQIVLQPDDLGAARRRFVERVGELSRFAAAVGVDLAIENNVVSPRNAPTGRNRAYLGVDADDLLGLLDDIGADNVGLLLDVGHLKVSARALDFDAATALRRILPRVRAVHLSDNDGTEDSNGPVKPDSWFWPLLRSSAATLVLEVYRIPPDAIVEQARLTRAALATARQVAR